MATKNTKDTTNTKNTGDSKEKRAKSPRGKKAADSAPMFDRRLMERQLASVSRVLEEHDFATVEEANEFLQNMVANGTLPEPSPETPLEQAQELAHKALTVSPDCADAYVLLAEETEDVQEARRLFEEGVRAGERALGPDAFTEDAGEFWGIMETRPYMRARHGLAEVLWALNEREAAIGHVREMLRLNPNDNQGIRYQLANWLLVVGDDEALDHLLAQYPEDWSASWAYTTVLHMFRRHGPGREAENALKHALEVNPFVPMYLAGLMPFPEKMPASYGMGDPNEAAVYIEESAEAWMDAPEAAAWMVEAMVRLVAPGALRAKPRAKAKAKPNAKPKGTSSRGTWVKKP